MFLKIFLIFLLSITSLYPAHEEKGPVHAQLSYSLRGIGCLVENIVNLDDQKVGSKFSVKLDTRANEQGEITAEIYDNGKLLVSGDRQKGEVIAYNEEYKILFDTNTNKNRPQERSITAEDREVDLSPGNHVWIRSRTNKDNSCMIFFDKKVKLVGKTDQSEQWVSLSRWAKSKPIQVATSHYAGRRIGENEICPSYTPSSNIELNATGGEIKIFDDFLGLHRNPDHLLDQHTSVTENDVVLPPVIPFDSKTKRGTVVEDFVRSLELSFPLGPVTLSKKEKSFLSELRLSELAPLMENLHYHGYTKEFERDYFSAVVDLFVERLLHASIEEIGLFLEEQTLPKPITDIIRPKLIDESCLYVDMGHNFERILHLGSSSSSQAKKLGFEQAVLFLVLTNKLNDSAALADCIKHLRKICNRWTNQVKRLFELAVAQVIVINNQHSLTAMNNDVERLRHIWSDRAFIKRKVKADHDNHNL